MRCSLLGALAAILTVCAFAPGQDSKAAGDVTITQRLGDSVPLDLRFRDETGASTSLRQFFKVRPVILVLAYYRCPRLCSVVLSELGTSLRKVDGRLGKDFDVVAVSIDPREGPELAAAKKAAQLEAYGDPAAGDGWHFLTGAEPEIKALADSVGFGYAYDPKTKQYAHASGIMVLTPKGKIARYFLGISYPPRDLQVALAEAGAGKVGASVGPQLRLLCFSYDPATGKYTLMTMRFVRLASCITVLGVVSFLFWSWRRGKQHA